MTRPTRSSSRRGSLNTRDIWPRLILDQSLTAQKPPPDNPPPICPSSHTSSKIGRSSALPSADRSKPLLRTFCCAIALLSQVPAP